MAAKNYDVTSVGLQVIDLLVDNVDAGLFARESTTADSVALALGGDALNQAVALSRLGSRTALMGAVGADQLGSTLLKLLGEYDLDVYDKVVDGRTSISVVLIGPDKERHFVRQPGQNEKLCFDHLDLDVIRRSRVVSVGSAMALTALDGAGMMDLLRLARGAGAITSLDFRINRPDYDMEAVKATIALADYVMPNEGEARYLTGQTQPPRMARALVAMGAGNVVIKLGGKGCYLDCGPVQATIPACPARVVDTTGAGDNFAAGLLHGLAKGWAIEHCARFACAAGAIAVEKVGANGAVVGEEQVLARMRQAYA